MNAEIIAIGAHKGGVGKSTSAINLAAGLAQSGWSTCLVDCDAQGNSTSMFCGEDDEVNDLYDVISGGVKVGDAIIETRIPGLHLLPSTLSNALLDQELFSKLRREEQIRRALSPIADRYDAFVLDLSPNLGATVIAALCAATSLVVPSDASRWGLRGTRMFLDWSQQLRDADVLTADLLGVLLTKYEPNTVVSREVLTELQDSPVPLFEARIPKRTGTERMVNNQVVIGDADADPDIAEAYARFTVEVIDRVKAAQDKRGRHRG